MLRYRANLHGFAVFLTQKIMETSGLMWQEKLHQLKDGEGVHDQNKYIQQ